jgi:hypothetical protein
MTAILLALGLCLFSSGGGGEEMMVQSEEGGDARRIAGIDHGHRP